jgi:hypothetical protein
VVVVVGVTETEAPLTGTLLAPVTGPLVELIVSCVAPVTDQLSVELVPFSIVEKKALKLAIVGGALNAAVLLAPPQSIRSSAEKAITNLATR